LLANGIPKDAILEKVISSNTIEEALKSKPLVQKYKPGKIVVITSDFHLEWASILFNMHLKGENLTFIGAQSTMEP
jgi:uncharacterized SAM-binding protein YcdF (DUF218 family)